MKPEVIQLLRDVADFLEEEADNRASAGSTMSDYANEPLALMSRVDAILSTLTRGAA